MRRWREPGTAIPTGNDGLYTAKPRYNEIKEEAI